MQMPAAALSVLVSLVSALTAQGWTDRTTLSPPPARRGHALCYDPVRQYTILYGGYRWSPNIAYSDTWTWDGTAWTQRGSGPTPTSSQPVTNCAMAFHGATGETLLVVDQSNSNGPNLVSYAWDGTQWNLRGSPSPGPAGTLSSLFMAYDPLLQQTVLYGTSAGGFWPTMSIWDGVSWSAVSLPVIPQGPTYPVSMAWDPVARRIALAVGGVPGNYTPSRIYEWNGLNWQQRLPATRPAIIGTMATDLARNRIVMFDSEYTSAEPNHTWTLANGVYTRLTTPTEPNLREFSAMAYDSYRGVCVLFGGSNGNPMGDTWEFDLGATAAFTTFGTGCLGQRGVPSIAPQPGSVPRIGSTFTLQASNLPWTGPAFVFLGLSDTLYGTTALPADLGFLGAPGCLLRCSGDELHVMPNALGSGAWSFVIPPFPGATFFTQVLPLDPAANALGLTVSNAGRAVIGL